MSNERKNINTDYDYIIHNVEITLDEEGRQFSIEWKDKEFTDRFSVAIDELPLCLRGRVKDGNSFLAGGTGAGKVGESCNLWHISRQERLEIGRSIFRFLDGDKGILKGAMETARDAGKKMLLYICACDRCEDWPFELLADGDEFLAPGDLCVIRRRSDYGKTARLKDPENRPLKLLFMSCAPVGGIRTGDCNWEEDAIRNVMEGVPIDMEVEDSGTLAGLKRKLMFRKYDIIHLSGYGGFDGNEHPYFVMENEEGGEHPVSPRELYEVALGLNPPRLVFLSMCCSQNEMSRLSADMFARILLEKFKVSAVLTWSFGIDSRQVGGGSGIFYRESARGRSIPEALWAVRKHFYTGPGEQLIDYIEKPGEDVDSPRPMLRLFSDGKPLAAMVSGNVTKTVNEFNMSLKSVGYPLPEEGGVGRRRQMQEILRVLKHSEEKAGVLIRGAAGLGKSRLALDACRRIHEYRVIIFDGKLDEFSMKETLQEFFLLEGDKEGLKILASSETFIEQLKRISTQCFRNNHYLLLLDNFEKNLERADKTGTEFILRSDTVEIVGVLLEHVNFGPNATRLIITSRYNFSLDKGAGDLVKKRLASVYMSGLYRSDQYRLARRLVDSTHTGGDSSLDWLTEQGRGNPRLMELLAGLLQEQSVSGNRGADGHERDSWSMENDPKMQGLTASASVAREDFVRDSGLADLLLHTSIRDQLLPLLRNLSVFRCPVPVKDFEELANAFGLNDWKKPLDMAIDLGMIEYNRFDGTYFLTPLLREVCSQEAVEGGKDAGVEMDGSPSTVRLHTIAYRYYHALSSSRKEETELGEECIYHALRCGKIRSVSQIGAVLVRRLRDELRQPRDARTKGEWILSGLMKKTGFPTFYDVDLLNETALTFKYQGKYKKAQEYYQMVAGIADISLDSRAGNRNNLGAIYLELGEYSKAEALFKENEDVVKTLYGEQSMALAFTLNNLGTARAHLKKYDEAAGLHKRALKILRKNRPAYSREIAGTYNNLGYVAAQKGNWERALEYYWQAYIINKKLHYTAHPDMAANLGNMASVIMKQAHAAGKKGKQDGSDVGGQDKKSLYFKAKEFCRHALQISRRTYGNMHLSTAIILSTLGDVCFQLKETEEAKKHYHGSRDIFRELAPNHLLLKKLDKKLLLNSETKILPPELEDIEMSLEVDAHPGVVSQDETFLDELRKVIEKNLSDMDFDIPKLCETLFLSRSTLNRRVKQITGETIGHYLRDYRLERGAHLLKNNNGNVTEVSVAVGFTDPYYFARSFKKKFGITPKAFQMGYLKKNAGTKSDS